MQKPIVSVLCITYNHERFIRPCLESLVSQKCNFPFEIVIHDDASTDDTQAIIKEFHQQYPELIKLILQTENQWSKNPGRIDVLYNNPLLTGAYIAICEGDDFWIGRDKLQKQVEILEDHPECSVTCGAYLTLYDNKEKVELQKEWKTKNQEDEKGRVFELDDLTNKFFIKTSTTLFRNLPALFYQLKNYEFSLDIHLFYLLLKSGNGYYSNEVIAAYNRHQDGIYSGSTSQEILLVKYMIIKDIYEKDRDEIIRKQYLKLTNLIINLKISRLMPDKKMTQNLIQNRNPSVFKIIKAIKPVLQTKAEHQAFYKSFIPLHAKLLKQKLRRALSIK